MGMGKMMCVFRVVVFLLLGLAARRQKRGTAPRSLYQVPVHLQVPGTGYGRAVSFSNNTKPIRELDDQFCRIVLTVVADYGLWYVHTVLQ